MQPPTGRKRPHWSAWAGLLAAIVALAAVACAPAPTPTAQQTPAPSLGPAPQDLEAREAVMWVLGMSFRTVTKRVDAAHAASMTRQEAQHYLDSINGTSTPPAAAPEERVWLVKLEGEFEAIGGLVAPGTPRTTYDNAYYLMEADACLVLQGANLTQDPGPLPGAVQVPPPLPQPQTPAEWLELRMRGLDGSVSLAWARCALSLRLKGPTFLLQDALLSKVEVLDEGHGLPDARERARRRKAVLTYAKGDTIPAFVLEVARIGEGFNGGAQTVDVGGAPGQLTTAREDGRTVTRITWEKGKARFWLTAYGHRGLDRDAALRIATSVPPADGADI